MEQNGWKDSHFKMKEEIPGENKRKNKDMKIHIFEDALINKTIEICLNGE
jgi:hypothetical protein